MELKDEFEALLNEHIKKLKKGDLVTGIICTTDSNGIGIDIGEKTLAFCSKKEIEEEFKIGDEFKFLIIDFDEQNEMYILSHKKLSLAYSWQELEKLKQEDEIIMANVVSMVKGGLIVEVLGIKGFIPSSQMLLKGKEYNCKDKIEVKILTLEPEKENFILSNKKVHSDLDNNTKKNIFSQIEVGQVLKGNVVRITNFGAFIDIGGIDGLLPLSQISWKWVEHPGDVLKLEDKINVEVLEIDKEKERISLSLKSLEEDPWILAKNEINEGDVITGEITRIRPFGVFVEIITNVEALLSQKEIDEYEKKENLKLNIGDKVKVKINKIDIEARKISLSL